MGILSDKCDRCGSKEHETVDCPHGILSDKCDKCGSTEHTTNDCPHGLLSDKCDKCGSIDHATNDCPHGILSDKCDKCGSTEHTTSDCPHGLLSDKCDKCGSIDHATGDCPHGIFTSEKEPEPFSDNIDDGYGLWETITDKAAAIGGTVGALAGLSEAYGSAESIGGYLLYIVIGAAAGGVLVGLATAMLPWVIGLGLLVLILKACGVG